MNEKSPFRITPQFVLGLILLLVGVLFTLDNLDILYAKDYLRYWPVLLIVYGLSKIFQPESRGGRFWGIVITFVGAALLADKLDIFSFRLWDLWPLLLVALGVTMLMRAASRRDTERLTKESGETESGSIVNAAAFLGGTKRNVHTRDFRGGELTAVMGGCDIDLRQSAIAKSPAMIDVFALWGGIEIKVPNTWTVIFEGTPILGGFDDKTFKQTADEKQRLIIRGTIIMGGVEVTN